MKLPGYTNLSILYEGTQTAVYSGLRESDGKAVILKTLRSEHPDVDQIALIYHEFEMTKDLRLPGVIETYALIDKENQYALVQENIGGIPLSKYLQNKPLQDLTSFLKLAIQMTRVLAEVHQHHIIHKDIKPDNFIINPETQLEKLTDFNYSTKLLHEVQDIVPPTKLEGTLAYMAPEQTGRMNMNIDYRSDFYALGVTFYEMLTGKLPFSYLDPLELLYAHLAYSPPALINSQFDIPFVLTMLVQKLMEKNPSQRYQSASGLLEDLERCQNELEKTGKIDSFALGQHDVLDQLNLSQKLYGREEEAKVLLAAYERVSHGAVEALMVCGYSGIGKTMLINEVHKPMVKQKGYFISGKFDQLQRNTPYTAITQAFNHLARLIMAEPEERFQAIKQTIVGSLGGVAQVMIDLAPDIELIIGPQPALDELPPQETQNRMMLVFKRFLKVIAQPDHPLVLFMDDLQWIDNPSLKLFEYMMTDPELTHLLLIGAYRDNEVSEQHPLVKFIKEIEDKGKYISTISLHPLTPSNFEAWFEDSFNRNNADIKILADLIHKRTEGNPFFCKQVINTIYKERLLYFDYKHHQWDWNLEGINDLKITDNVVDLMLGKLTELPEKTQTLLKYASCVGNHFTIDTLMVISDQSAETIGQALWYALEKDLILTQRLGYKRVGAMQKESLTEILSKDITYQFVHDRVQQAVYQCLTDDDKKRSHLRIAKLLLKNDTVAGKKERLFEVVDHFNRALDLLSVDEKLEVINLNYEAGVLAKKANAYQPMFNYLKAAIGLLGENPWEHQYEYAFKIYKDYALSLYLLHHVSEAEELVSNLLIHAQTNFDKASLYRILIMSYRDKGEHDKSLDMVYIALRLLGVKLQKNATLFSLFIKYHSVQWKMRKFNISMLENELPNMSNTSIETAFDIFMESYMLFYQKSTASLGYLFATAMDLIITYGKPRSAGFWVTNYGILILNMNKKNINRTFEYWTLAQRLFEEFPDKYTMGPAYTMAGFLFYHLRYHIDDGIPLILKGINYSNESGNLFMENIGLNMYSIASHAKANSVKNAITATNTAYEANLKKGIVMHAEIFEFMTLLFENWSVGKHANTDKLNRIEKNILGSGVLLLIESSQKYLSVYYYFLELYQKAIESHFIWYLHEDRIRFEPFSYEAKAVNALTLAKLMTKKQGIEKWRYQKRFSQLMEELKWASSAAPANYLHHYLFLLGAEANIKKNLIKALIAFNKGIDNAKKGGFYLWAALGNELAADLFLEQNQLRPAIDYIREAHYYYKRYGMTMKVQSLEKRYPHCFVEKVDKSATEMDKKLTSSITNEMSNTTLDVASIDLLSLMKSTQAISSEIELDKLLEKLIIILLQNAGAHRVHLLVKEKDIWYVEAEGTTSEQRITLAHTESFDQRHDLPITLIRYVERTQESVLIQTPQEVENYAKSDEYIRTTQPQSMLVIPVFYHGELQSILYLENHSVSMAFKNEHVRILQILSSQTAISLQNARLYYQATHDALTGLANRNLLYHVFELATNKAKTTHASIAILLFDLDYFKTINDTYGHFVGDKVLTHIANLITLCIGKENLAARLGGDEFVAMMEYQDISEIIQAAESFLLKLKTPVKIDGHELTLSSSIGISVYPHDGESVSDLLKQADIALYHVKAKGKNQFQLYTTSLQIQSKHDHSTETDLH